MATTTRPAPVVAPSAPPSHPRNIVPPVEFVAHGVSPVVGAPPPSLSNHGGPVLSAVQVVPVYWGAAWGTGTNAALPGQLDAFFDFILTSSLIDLLGEYSTGSTAIGHGSRLSSVSIASSEPGTANPAGGGRTVTDAQLQTSLQGFIKAGTVPAVTANTLYFLFLPPNVAVQQSSTSSSCTQFCGYHNSFGSGVYYAVIPFANCSGCQFAGAFLDTLTEVSSHELCEAITDPALNAWWDSNSGNEIGDICNRQTVRMGGYLVQTEWSNSQNSCVFSPALTAPGSRLDGYATEFNNQQHVNFIGTDNHVHELFYDNQWHQNDLSNSTGAPAASPQSPLVGYQTSFNQQQHINFLSSDGHVHELVYSNGWHHNDLTALAGAPPAASGSSLDSYQTAFNRQQHINYLTADNHVHELFYTDSWRHNDLTAIAGAPPAAAGSSLDGYATEWNEQQHVNYVGDNDHVHELVYSNGWHHNDLCAITGAPPSLRQGALDGYATTFNQQQHVNFLDSNNHVHELVYTGAWHHNDLTNLAGAPPAAAGTPLDGYQTAFNGQQHINFLTADGHVHELFYANGWHHNDLTLTAGAPPAGPGSSLDGYPTEFNQQQHVNYIGADSHVHELFYTSAWRHNDLTVL